MKKKITTIIVCIILGVGKLSAQCWETINTPTTDWTKSNSSNTWDWTQEYFDDLYIKNRTNPVTRVSPFWAPQPSTNQNVVLYDFQKHTQKEKKDFFPEDGWELLVKNFGLPGASNANAVEYPFFALYNRYSGKVRAFLLVPTVTGNLKSSALLRASFISGARRTALFQHMQPIAQTVESFENLGVDMPNEYSNASDYWLFSEFVVAYDPCTCEDLSSSKESRLELVYFLIDESEIDAEIVGKIQDKVTNGGKPATSDPSFALNDLGDVKKVVDAGQKGYKEWGKYKDTYNKYLNQFTDAQYRDKLWKSIDTLRYVKPDLHQKLIDDIFVNKGVLEFNEENFVNGDILLDAEELYIPGRKTSFLDENYSELKALASVLPYVGTAIGVIDLLVDGGGSKSSAAVKGPTVFEANLQMSGTLKKLSPLGPNAFYTPGYTTDPDLNFKPTYNNILGVFNVLELPDFEYYVIKPIVTNYTKGELDIDLRNDCEKNKSDFHNMDGAEDVIFKQYKPKSGLKYVVNPASELEVVSAEVALVTRYEGKDDLFIDRPADFQNKIAMPFYSSITRPMHGDTTLYYGWQTDLTPDYRPNQYIQNHSSLANGWYENNGGHRISSSGAFADNLIPIDIDVYGGVRQILDIESETNLILDMKTDGYPSIDTSRIQFRTDYLPITCFDQLSMTLLGNNNFGKVFAKVIVILQHKTKTDMEYVKMILCYDITQKLKDATKNTTQEGFYSTTVWGTNWELSSHCCYLCGTGLSFTSGEISNYRYMTDMELLGVPHSSLFFEERNKTYAGESSLTILGSLNIPDNSVVPSNSVIKAGGAITFGENVSIGSGSKFYSTTAIENPNINQYGADVTMDIINANELKYGCTNYNYAANHLTSGEIASFCQTAQYKDKAVLYKSKPEEKDDPEVSNLLDFNLVPNPSNGKFKLDFSRPLNDYEVEVTDVNGRVVFRAIEGSTASEYHVNIGYLEAGVYFVRLIENSSADAACKKLIKTVD